MSPCGRCSRRSGTCPSTWATTPTAPPWASTGRARPRAATRRWWSPWAPQVYHADGQPLEVVGQHPLGGLVPQAGGLEGGAALDLGRVVVAQLPQLDISLQLEEENMGYDLAWIERAGPTLRVYVVVDFDRNISLNPYH